MTCLPVKPMVELIDHNPVFELCTGALPMHLHLIYACCFLYNKVTFLDLPVIEPTEYMFRNYNGIINGDNFGEEKWHIYMEVTRHIMSEISGLKLSNVNFPEKLDYMSEIKMGNLVITVSSPKYYVDELEVRDVFILDQFIDLTGKVIIPNTPEENIFRIR